MLERDPTSQGLFSRVLSDQQQLLYRELQKRDRLLAQIYIGAVWVFSDSENPERVPQSAYSMREMMNKLPYFEVEEDRSPDLYHRIKRTQELWVKAVEESHCFQELSWKGEIDESLSAFLSGMIEFFNWYKCRPTITKDASQFIQEQYSASYYPESLHKEVLKRWMKAYGFFNGVLHYDKLVMHDEFERVLRDTEGLLLEMFLPEPTEDFDSLDALIREGENDARH